MATKPLGEDQPQLRTDAESRLTEASEADTAMRARPADELLHELQVHQIELEMQNDELRRAQQTIEESRDRYLDLYDFAPIGYLSLDRSAVIVEANLTVSELFGVTRKELLKQRFANFVSPENREHWNRQFMDSMNPGKKQGCELTLRRADGALFHARLDCLCMKQDDASLLTRIALTDITERRLAQQHLAGLVESATDAIVSVDEDQLIVLFNPAAERMFGSPAAEVLGQPLDALLPVESRLVHAEHLRTFARSGLTSRNINGSRALQGRRANGDLFPIEASISQIEMQGHRRFTVILRETTERRKIELALRDSQADLNRAQAVGQIGSWRLDLERNELRWSDENHRIFGIPKGTPLTYESFLTIVHPEDRDYVDRMWRAALRGAPYDIEHRLVVNGEVKWVREKAELEFDATGSLLSGFGTTQDITELKSAERALTEADKRKDEFLAMLGHELRNPLTPIRNAAHVLGRLETREPQIRWARETIERQVTHLTRLVDDLLDVSRIARGKVALHQETLSFADIVDQALNMARPLIEAKGHRLELRLPERPVWLRGDPVRLAQVLLNLLDNAAKYTPEGGLIELEASVEGAMIDIKVRDNGIGIPGDLLPHIFDLFLQGERTLDRAQGGLGIGLTLVKRLLEMHGGQIETASAGPGLGSEFTIRLPALVDTAKAAGTEMAKASPATVGCRVLVVDDNPVVLDSMSVLLALEGQTVRTATDGAAALELARVFHPQLVLLDIGLHGMDGYEVARRLRDQQAPDEALYLVAVTGYGHEEARMRSREAGFDLHLVKPVQPEAICALVAEIGGAPAPP
ncbi:MAG: PAS domain S-box protein [Gallionellaceae bacterium]|nr:PAS domain S-box protein [Gallionellaceae bacterium]